MMAISEHEPRKANQLAEAVPHFFYVKEWNGSTWQILGDGLPPVLECAVLRLDSQGNPYVAGKVDTSWGPFTENRVVLYRFTK
jgi:hypothetical protein